jgi:hypothetical protein
LALVGVAAGVEDFSAGALASSSEAVETGLIVAEPVASLVPIDFSWRAYSFSSLESLRMMVMRRLSRWSRKLSNYLEKVDRNVTAMQLSTRTVDSSRCIEHIINPLQHWVKHVKAIKTKDSMKLIKRSQCMKLGSTKASDQCLPIGQ